MDFSLWTCSWRGHATYAPDETELAARLHVSTPAGEAWRCLRCGDFAVGEPRHRGPADEAPEVPRGRLLRDRFIMRLLAVERALRGMVFVALAAGVFKVRYSQAQMKAAFDQEMPLIRPLADQIGWNPDNSKIVHFIEKGWTLSPTTLVWIALGLLAYAAIEFIEATGLWLVKRWGEYFAVIATSVFLPLEIYELTEKITVLRLGALLINIAAVIWLLWSKRLFGLNGGGRAYHAEHSEESLLTVERAAVAATSEQRALKTGSTPLSGRCAIRRSAPCRRCQSRVARMRLAWSDAVSPKGEPLILYVTTRTTTRKVRNVRAHPDVAFVVPVPRRFIPGFPPRAVQFQGTATVVAGDHRRALRAFASSWFLRRILVAEQRIVTQGGDLCFLCIRPDPTVFTYGIGMSLWHNVRQPRDAIGRVKIRDDGLSYGNLP